MPTVKNKLPTINPTDTANVPRDHNALATAVDNALGDLPAMPTTAKDAAGAISELHRSIGNINVTPPDNSITDAMIGNRTISDSTAPTGDIGQITTLFSWIANMITKITGKPIWRTAPRTTLENAVKRNGDDMSGDLRISKSTPRLYTRTSSATDNGVNGLVSEDTNGIPQWYTGYVPSSGRWGVYDSPNARFALYILAGSPLSGLMYIDHTVHHSGNHGNTGDPHNQYLLKSGGTVTGATSFENTLTMRPISATGASSSRPIFFITRDADGTTYSNNYIQVLGADRNLYYFRDSIGSLIWSQGNHGPGSGLHADLVDGFHATTSSTANSIVVQDANQEISVHAITLGTLGRIASGNAMAAGVAGGGILQQTADTGQGYGLWQCANCYWNGTAWIQIRGDSPSYAHGVTLQRGRRFIYAAAGGTNGKAITMTEISSESSTMLTVPAITTGIGLFGTPNTSFVRLASNADAAYVQGVNGAQTASVDLILSGRSGEKNIVRTAGGSILDDSAANSTFRSTRTTAATPATGGIAHYQLRNGYSADNARLRFAIGMGNPETGSGNTGSDFHIWRYDDAGAGLGTAFSIKRSTGEATFSGNVQAARLVSAAAQGTSPLYVNSTTRVDRLNAALVDGLAPHYAATPNTVAARGDNGTLKAANPVANDDLTTRGWVEGEMSKVVMKTTKPCVADLIVNSATNGTYYQVVNFTGKGRLSRIAVAGSTTNNNYNIRLTIDGVASTLNTALTTINYARGFMHTNASGSFSAAYSFDYLTNIEFNSSIKVEIMQSSGGTVSNITVAVDFASV